MIAPITERQLHAIDAYWRAANYLSVGQIYLMDNPLLRKPLAAEHLNPARDGAVLPILHLNGYKIANPALLGRIRYGELEQLLTGYGYKPFLVEGDKPASVHRDMATTLDAVMDEIQAIQQQARGGTKPIPRPRWPMIVLKTPKGWTGPREVDGKKTEGHWRSHQVPFKTVAGNPAHNPVQLEGIETIERMMRGVPQVTVFDTAFHRTMPDAAAMYPLPFEWFDRGIRRYGFHGISHQYCTERAAELLDRRVNDLRLVTCHLGNGCSLAAVRDGVSVDTTMGLTPLEGVMMASRSGSIDPAIPLYLMREHGLDNDRVNAMLNAASGLKGVSGLSGDMRAILDAVSDGHPRATLALDMYVHRLRKAIGGMVAVLGGADALIFTAGVGEYASTVRERTCCGLESMGIQIDPERNRTARADDDIAAPDSPTRILIVHTDEDWITARACRALLDNGD